jgi:hypothetical protein
VGQIRCFLKFFFLIGRLWWQELWLGRKRKFGFSPNKSPCFFLWRLSALVLLHGTERLSALFPVKPLRWRSSNGNEADEAFFNEQMLLRRWGSALLRPSSLTGYGGEKRGGKPTVLCSEGGSGTSSSIELIHADIIFSSVILCRYGGNLNLH